MVDTVGTNAGTGAVPDAGGVPDGYVLTADVATHGGKKWATVGSGGVSSAVALVQENTDTVTLAVGGTQAIPDVTVDTIHYYTFGAGNATLTFPTAAAGKSCTVALKQDATGSRTITWPGTVKWSGGTAPTLTTAASKTDVFSFVCLDGTNWLGFTAGLNF